ncbi:unnamed protein product [Moneuplotes crassus]|uniref:Sfi1 spindle body domain-containing protein n=1 Tax=Euplotes crassus TaxID=5936 RepID=A0AAD2DBJ4_EUPCR|nr:unnamed protein product [Moneuplotes crassus]
MSESRTSFGGNYCLKIPKHPKTSLNIPRPPLVSEQGENIEPNVFSPISSYHKAIDSNLCSEDYHGNIKRTLFNFSSLKKDNSLVPRGSSEMNPDVLSIEADLENMCKLQRESPALNIYELNPTAKFSDRIKFKNDKLMCIQDNFSGTWSEFDTFQMLEQQYETNLRSADKSYISNCECRESLCNVSSIEMIDQYYYLKVLNKVFNGWCNYVSDQQYQSQVSLEAYHQSVADWEDDSHTRLAEEYRDQTLATKAFISLAKHRKKSKAEKQQKLKEETHKKLLEKRLKENTRKVEKYLRIHKELTKHQVFKALKVYSARQKIESKFLLSKYQKYKEKKDFDTRNKLFHALKKFIQNQKAKKKEQKCKFIKAEQTSEKKPKPKKIILKKNIDTSRTINANQISFQKLVELSVQINEDCTQAITHHRSWIFRKCFLSIKFAAEESIQTQQKLESIVMKKYERIKKKFLLKKWIEYVANVKRMRQKEKIAVKHYFKAAFFKFRSKINQKRISNKAFYGKLNKICKSRARRILKVVYSSWAYYTKKNERRRKASQIAALFYLKTLYTKAFTKGLKWNYELNRKCYNFQYNSTLKVAAECLTKWKNEYYSMTVIHEVDYIHAKKTKQRVFNTLKEICLGRKNHREIHNKIVLAKFRTLKQKAILALAMNVKHQRKNQKRIDASRSYHRRFRLEQIYQVLKSNYQQQKNYQNWRKPLKST